jgi:acyl-CoA dehydrogenase
MLALGECFCLIAYRQLILENAPHIGANDDLVGHIFDFMVRDMSRHALNLFNKPSSSAQQQQKALAIIQSPVAEGERFARVWQTQVLALKGSYPTGC